MALRLLTVLTLVALMPGCSPAVVGPGVAEVDFLWVRTRDGQVQGKGGASHAVLKVEPSSTGMQVGIFESKPGGTGEMWRAAVWVAALTGTLSVNADPLAYRYSVETETLAGKVDGPSAGGLFAVAVMAALSGAKLDPQATLTGMINPDGTIGPVGGVVEKLLAARENGKRRFCYPSMQRQEPDPGGGAPRDLDALAVELGMVARPVENLAQAYECLVNQALPTTKPVRRSGMALTGELYDQMHAKTGWWLEQTDKALAATARYKEMDRFTPFFEVARKDVDEARRLLQEGLVAVAYWKAVSAYCGARTVLLSAATVERLAQGDPVEALKLFTSLEEETEKRLGELFQALAKVEASSVHRSVLLLDGYEAAISAVVNREFAKAQYGDILRRMKSSIEGGQEVSGLISLFAELYQPLSEMALAEVNAQLARDNLELADGISGGMATAHRRIDQVAKLFQGAASANIEYFDAMFVREVSERANKPAAAVTAALMEKEPNYRTAQFNLRLPESGKLGYASQGLPASLANLAGAISSFFASSTLVAKFYSIGVTFDEDGEVAGVEREEALIKTLALAEERARLNAALAERDAGGIPASARIAYQIGMVMRDREGYAERLEALEHFWRSSVWSQVAVYLARLEQGGR